MQIDCQLVTLFKNASSACILFAFSCIFQLLPVMEIIFVFLVIIAGVAMWHQYQRWLYHRELRQYAQRTRPIIEHSRHEHDDMVSARAEYHAKMLRESGNPWGVPVHQFHYRSLKESGGNELAGFDDWDDYIVSLAEYIKLVRNTWSAKIKGADEMSYKQRILGQRDFQPD